MKKYIFILLLGLFYAETNAQEIFSFDFSTDPVDEFIVWDVNKNTPTKEMQGIGFKIGSPWVKIRESNNSSNWFFGSTSSYDPAGTANNWLVTKALFIQAEGCVLEWKSQAYDPQKRDGLKIFISTIGQNVKDFPEIPEWEIEEESAGISNDKDVIEGDGEWSSHSIPLDKYAGKTIYIAFVNQSHDKSIVFIDDIWVGKPLDYTFMNLSEKYITSTEGEIKGMITVINDEYINAYTAHYSYEGKEFSKEYANLNLKKGDKHEFVFDEKIPLELHQSIEYKIWITKGEESSMFATESITRVSHFPKRTVVIEEGTGTWCQYCVTGMWAMDYLYETTKESNDFIGIAVHNGDPMTYRPYNNGLGLNSFPVGVINRKVASSPLGSSFEDPWGDGSWVSHYLKEKNVLTFSEITVEGEFNNDSTKIAAKAIISSILAQEEADYRIAFVLLENGVTGYSQLNAYSGAPYFIGGFEKMSNPCYPVFNDVARGIYPEFTGAKGSIPSTFNADQTIEYSYEITIPKSVDNIKNLRLVALLLDGKKQEILNADILAMTNESEIRTSAIKEIKADDTNIQTEIRDGNLFVYVNTDNKIEAHLFDVTGKTINEINANGKTWFMIPAKGYKGIALLQIIEGKCISSKKIVL